MRPAVHDGRKKLPGNMRQRIKRIIDGLAQSPRPARSIELDLPGEIKKRLKDEWEVRRIRLENWRIVYAINEEWSEIGVLAIQKRPPYDYEDLEKLLSEL